MTKILRNALVAMSISLATCSTGCTKTQVVQVPVVPPTCHLALAPQFPVLKSQPCGEFVCLTPEDTTLIWLFVRDTQRWFEVATVCLDSRGETP